MCTFIHKSSKINADVYKDNFNLSFTQSNVNSMYQYRNDFQRNIQSK